MSKTPLFITALVLQLAAQALGGVWGAAVGGVLIGVALRRRGAFLIGFGAAGLACALLLGMIAVRGGNLMGFAPMMGGNFGLPGWGVLLVSVLLPAVQSGGLAGGVSAVLRRE